jgi:hypothetical protein
MDVMKMQGASHKRDRPRAMASRVSQAPMNPPGQIQDLAVFGCTILEHGLRRKK